MKFVSDLADEVGTVSAGLHIQNGMDIIYPHKRRLDLRSADKRAKEAGDPGMEGPQK